MTKDYTKIPAKVTLTNVNEAYIAADVDDAAMNASKGDVVVNYFQTNLTEVLKPGDILEIVVTSSEAVAYYSQLATEELTVEVAEMG